MVKNYILVAVRNLRRYLSYTVINVLGLSLGIACALLIFLLVSHHLSYDRYHPELDRVYRIVTDATRGETTNHNSAVPAPLGKAIREDYTYTEKIARLATFNGELITVNDKGELKKFTEPNIAFAEPDFFQIFSIPMEKGGDASRLIAGPHAAIISGAIAKKFFGDEDPLNKVFRLGNTVEFTVVGIMKEVPDNTDFRSEIYVAYNALIEFDDWLGSDDSWGGISTVMECYTRLKPGVDIAKMEEDMFGYVKKHRPNSKNVHHYRLQPITERHTDTRYDGAMGTGSLLALSMIGLFLIITACVNFINLATARATSRSREVGVRKVLGGIRSQILWQFMSETFVITLVSTVLAIAVVSALLPFFNVTFDSRLALNVADNWAFLVFLPILVLFVTAVAGFYPGMILSGFQAAEALKGKHSQARVGGLNLRRALIITQFSISQILIIVLIVVVYQINYSKNADMGFEREATITVPIGSFDEKAKTVKKQLEQLSGVQAVSLCWSAPSSTNVWHTSVRIGNEEEEANFSISARPADENYLDLFGIDLVAGRNLVPSDTAREFLVNEKFAEKVGKKPEELLGTYIRVNGEWRFPIVGVVRNFHDFSFHGDISPIFMATSLNRYGVYAVKLDMQSAKETLAAIEDIWSKTYPDQVYSYQFVDDQIAEFYTAEENVLRLIQVFSFVAILVGCMGLFGLVSFMAVQRTKEIGIRKVLGSSIVQILWIFGREFSLLIVIAFAIAAPVGYYVMSKWLESYQFKITMNGWIFFAAIASTFVVAIVTVGYRSVKAAMANPVNSLRSE